MIRHTTKVGDYIRPCENASRYHAACSCCEGGESIGLVRAHAGPRLRTLYLNHDGSIAAGSGGYVMQAVRSWIRVNGPRETPRADPPA